MTDNYKAPFEGGKTPDPARTAKVKNIAKNLARKAMKKAATVKESAVPERPYRKVYEPTSAQELNPGLRAKIDAASNAQKPRPLSGMRPIDKIKLMTRKEEVELDEAFINGREFAAHGLMHPKHAGEPIHRVADHYVDFYASGTGDKMQGKVKLNDGKSVHIQAHPKMGDGKLHKFKVSANLPKTNEEVEQIDELSKKTLSSYVKKAYWDQGKRMAHGAEVYGYVAGKYGRKATRGEVFKNAKEMRRDKTRDTGVERALSRLAKEDYAYDRIKKVIPPTKKPEPVSKKGFGQLGPEKRENNKGSNSHMSEMAASERNRYEEPKPKTPGRPKPIPDGLPRPGNRPKPIPAMGALKKIQEKKMGYDQLISTINSKRAKKKLKEATDPVGGEDADINNDGKTDSTDVFLHRKRRAIGKAISTRLTAKAGK